jgi:two-component system cell cycle sensor histidine kinase/response regulator CckA
VSDKSPAVPRSGNAAASSEKKTGPAVLWLEANGRIAAANASALRLWQAAESELIGEHIAALFAFEVTSKEPDFLDAQWDVLMAAGLDQPIPLKAQPREGAPLDVTFRLEKITAAQPGFCCMVEAGAQPSESAPAAAAADRSDDGLALLAEKGTAGFFDLNFKEDRIRYAPAWKRILGYVDAELPNTIETWHKLIHPEDSGAAPDKLAKNASPGPRAFSVEFRMKHRLGHDVWIQSMGVQVVGADGKLERVVGIHVDISERKELEEESLINDERLQILSDPDGSLPAFDLDFSRERFWYSDAWKHLLGRPDDAGDSADLLLKALPPEQAEAGVAAFFLGRATGKTSFVEPVKLIHSDGRTLTFLLGATRQLNRKKELSRVTGFFCTVPEGLAAAAAPTGPMSPDVTQALFAALAEGVIVSDAKGAVSAINPAAARLLGLSAEKARGQSVSDIFRLVNRQSGKPGDDVVDRTLGTDGTLGLIGEHSLVTFDPAPAGTESAPPPLPIVWTARAALDKGGRPLNLAVVFRDPEEMRLTPEELVKANRFEALGLLAGGIAHDFNNLLTTIMGAVSLAKDNRDYSALDDGEKACLTAKGLTKQLLAFAKGGTGTQIVAATKEILDDAVKIAAAASTAVVTVEVPPETGPVLVDRAQILQVFQNLIVNALQAMPGPPHQPRLQIQTTTIRLKDDEIPGLPGGDYISIAVRDNGSGIKPEHLEKIWDPFFTTKKHGTGLGLATVLSIVRKHGGQIGLESTVGVGTVFTVFLPVADKPVEVQARKAPSLRFGTGRILLMDDDPKISALTANMLQSLEYKYDLAKNGEEAITFYKRYLNIGRPYDVVIMDLTVVGGMGGEECFVELKKLDPEVRAIVSSGYDNEDMARQFLDKGFCGYLTKPYRVTDLGKVIKAVVG